MPFQLIAPVFVQVQGFQVNALMRKSWAYQRKNASMNICTLMSPIVCATVLVVLQYIIDKSIEDSVSEFSRFESVRDFHH